jgi:transposase
MNKARRRTLDSSEVELLKNLYVTGKKSIPEVSKEMSRSQSTLRRYLLEMGALRAREDAIRIASPKISKQLKGRKRSFSEEHKQNLRNAIREREKTAHREGVYLDKNSGYLRATQGENCGKNAHVVIMEELVGVKLDGLHVHHIDGNKTNNNPNNLAIMTRSAHGRLHRLQDKLANINRKRNERGQFLKGERNVD